MGRRSRKTISKGLMRLRYRRYDSEFHSESDFETVVWNVESPLFTGVACVLAEGVGFEPTVALRLRLISSQVPLTTQPPFRASRC